MAFVKVRIKDTSVTGGFHQWIVIGENVHAIVEHEGGSVAIYDHRSIQFETTKSDGTIHHIRFTDNKPVWRN